MSAFWIFVACLTAAYAIYYTVIITGDLMGKPKDQRSSSEETFDLGDFEPESSRAVEETDGGFRVSREDGSTLIEQELAVQTPAEEQRPGESDEYAPKLDATGAVISPTLKKIDSVQEDMEEIEAEQSTELASGMMVSALLHGKPDVPIDKTVIPGGSVPPKEGKEKEVDDDDGSRV